MKIQLTLGSTVHLLDLERITMREAAEMKAKIGMNSMQWQVALSQGDGEAAGFAWWWACQRAGDKPDWQAMFDELNVLDVDFELIDDEPEPDETPGPTSPDSVPAPTTESAPGGPSSPATGPDSATNPPSGI